MNSVRSQKASSSVKQQSKATLHTSKRKKATTKKLKKQPKQKQQHTKPTLQTLNKRNFAGCGSSCGCGPTEPEPIPEPEPIQQQQGGSCGSGGGCGSHDNNNNNGNEFSEPQYNDRNIQTIEKMRKQQREFSLRLYRSILRAHRHLPPEMRMLGDPYVIEEFRLHKNAKPEHLQPFFEQWIDYLGHLRNAFDQPEQLGQNIPIETVDQLNDEQKEKLFKMHDETYRIFGGELNETDVGLSFDEIPEHLRESGIFGKQPTNADIAAEVQTDTGAAIDTSSFAKSANVKKFKLNTTSVNTPQDQV